MKLEAVTFDLWDTLVYNKNYSGFRLKEIKKLFTRHGFEIDEGKLHEAYLNGFNYSRKVIHKENYRHVETSEIVDKFVEYLELNSLNFHSDLVKIYEEAILQDPPKLKDGVFEVLDYVYGHYKIGLISVTGVSPGRIVRSILEKYRILDYFDVLTFSDEVKKVKPNPELFHSCLNQLKVDPKKAIHVGDSYKGDVVGALDSGMNIIWLKTREQEEKAGYMPNVTISSLYEVPEVLRYLNKG